MRFILFGPRLFRGLIRPGVSFGPEDLRRLQRPSKTSRTEMNGSFIYVFKGDHNMTKVGVSTNPNARLSSLRTASPFPIDYAYVGVTPGNGFDIERKAHELLHHHRCNGEWFDVPTEMAVAAVHGAAHALNQPIQPLKPEWIDEILRIGASQDAQAQKSPLPLRIVTGTVKFIAAFTVGIIIFAVVLLLFAALKA